MAKRVLQPQATVALFPKQTALQVILAFETLLVVALICSCQRSDKIEIITPPAFQDSTITTPDSLSLTTSQIFQAVYSSYKFPKGFYEEDLQGGAIYYENSVSIKPLSQRQPHWFELSTNDRDQAFAWSESSAVNSAYYRQLQSETQTEKYFEFRRVYQNYPSDILLSRVHKQSYLDASMVDRFYPDSLIGVFNLRPIDTVTIRTLIEYLWFVGTYNAGAKVLVSIAKDHSLSVDQILYVVLVSYGDWGVSDQIVISRALFSVDKQTGKIYKRVSAIKTLAGRMN